MTEEPADNIIRLAELMASDRREVVQLRPGALHDTAAKAEACLIEAGLPLYDFGGMLVVPVVDEVKAFRGRRTKVVRLKRVTADAMRLYLSAAARFERFDARRNAFVATDPPRDVAQAILDRDDGRWGFPRVSGTITTQTMRPDGSILADPGYDHTTGLLLMSPPEIPSIAETPTPQEAREALDLLLGLLAEFPFTSEADRTAALSALMTPVVRGALQVAPLHVLEAPEAGSGKSYLIDLAAAIATGEVAPVIAAGRNEEESEKRLAAELFTGQAIISIDNLNGDLAGDFLCQLIERPIVRPRVLGKSETKAIPNKVTVFANGNNLRLVGDVVRRAVRSRLDAQLERPELRQFRGDPLQTILADRGKYVAAVLTIARAYQIAGCPSCLPPLASFGDWSRLVRSALVWLGCDDPLSTMDEARNEDLTRGNLQAVIAAWREAVGPDVAVTAGDLRKRALGHKGLEAALLDVASNRSGDAVEARRLGRWLGRNKGRVMAGEVILGWWDPHACQQVWRLKGRSKAELEL